MTDSTHGIKCGRSWKAGEHRETLELALEYRQAGLSVIPIRRDGSKTPALRSWTEFQARPASEEEIGEWFAREPVPGIGLVCGEVSGGLHVLDFEFRDFFEEWERLVEAVLGGVLLGLPRVHTPGKDEAGGVHVYVRSSGQTMPSTKLARITKAEAERRTGDPGKTTAIELKGEHGQVLTVGCPADCHPTGRLYRHAGGPQITETPTLDADQVQTLLDCARALERGDKAAKDAAASRCGGVDGNRPGDEFNRRADWIADVLGPKGWSVCRSSGEVLYVTRPGKPDGISASIGHCTSEKAGPKLYVFSTSTELEAERSYSKYEAFTFLHHQGDFKASARELGQRGYGEPARRREAPRVDHGQREDDGDPLLQVGPFTLRLVSGHRTPKKVVAEVDALHEGQRRVNFNVSSAGSSFREAARRLRDEASLVGHPVEYGDVAPALNRVIVLAAAAADESAAAAAEARNGVPTIAEILRDSIEDRLRITHRTRAGALWSELQEREIRRNDFTNYQPADLVELCQSAADAPKLRLHLLAFIRSEMGVLFSSLLERLHPIEHADLSQCPARVKEFRRKVVGLWLKPNVCTQVRNYGALTFPRRFSLSGLAREKLQILRAKSDLHGNGWIRLDDNFNAWCRPYVFTKDGELRLALAMTFPLVAQLGGELPGCDCHADFQKVGESVGALLSPAGVNDLFRGPTTLGGELPAPGILSVLTPELTEGGILYAPELGESGCPKKSSGEQHVDSPGAEQCK